ncbi:MAG: DEAD/DEAH box helicase [Planctomycetota bacterium]
MIQQTSKGQTESPTGDNEFAKLGLSRHLCDAVSAAGYETPTPIQEKAIPMVLRGSDLLGCAQTGTGKTAAFALPILHHLADDTKHGGARRIRVLVLAPTRELAAQIGASFGTYARGTRLRHHVIFGGVGKGPQKKALRAGLDILVATPGRLLDLMGEGLINLSGVTHLVLDEADRKLDMGFIKDVRRIVKEVPRNRQTLLFSATMPDEIRNLAKNILRDPQHVAVDPVSSTVEPISQAVYFVEKSHKINMLLKLLQDRDLDVDRALVFTRTKHGANKVAKKLDIARVSAAAIHGNKSQTARERALAGFKRGDLRVLVATDIAARGIDIKELSHVINFDLPNEPESYVHRVGRTGRAGLTGAAISFCAFDERSYLRDIEKLIKRTLDRPAGSPPDVRPEPDRPAVRTSFTPRADSRSGSQQRTRSGGRYTGNNTRSNNRGGAGTETRSQNSRRRRRR